MGLDAGPGYLMKIADELTVVGSPVVGAVRMVTAAALEPREIVANVFLGRNGCTRNRTASTRRWVSRSTRTLRPSKEYPKGQEVYALTFARDDGPDPGSSGEPTAEGPDASPAKD